VASSSSFCHFAAYSGSFSGKTNSCKNSRQERHDSAYHDLRAGPSSPGGLFDDLPKPQGKPVMKPVQFEDIYPAELNAVEARRRRYRTEQLLGFLPEAPAETPATDRYDPEVHAGQAREGGTREALKQERAIVEKCREVLEHVRQQVDRGHGGHEEGQ